MRRMLETQRTTAGCGTVLIAHVGAEAARVRCWQGCLNCQVYCRLRSRPHDVHSKRRREIFIFKCFFPVHLTQG